MNVTWYGSEQEAQNAERGPVLPEGWYEAVVTAAENQTSKKGNEMVKLTLAVYDDDGKKRTAWDYLLNSFPVKLRHFAEAAEIDDKVRDTGRLTADMCREAHVKVLLGIRNSTEYGEQNEVRDYEKWDGAARATKKADNDYGYDDSSIPF